MKTTTQENIKTVLKQLLLTVNGVECKGVAHGLYTSKKIDFLSFDETNRNNFLAISEYVSPFDDVKVSFKYDELVVGETYTNGDWEHVEKNDNIITISGDGFEYKFAPEMLLHVYNQFSKIKIKPVAATKTVKVAKALPETKQAQPMKATETKAQPTVIVKTNDNGKKVSVIDYSDKAIAVVGDTIYIKNQLKDMGGRYNKFLSCGAGWIFPKKHTDTVKQELSKVIHVQ